MISLARRKTWQRAAAFCVTTCLRVPCRAGDFARRLGFAASLGLRDDASIVPYGRGAGPCRGLQDTCGSRRQYTLPSAPCGASTSPCRGGFANGFHPKGSPARGAVGASRLRGAAPCPTNTFPGLAASLGLRDDASIVSYGRGAGPCRGLKDTCGSRRQCTPPPALRAPPLTGEAFGGRLSRWVGSCRRLAGRCQHRPLRMRGRALPGFEGYLRGRAAMHPSARVAGTSPYRGGFWRAASPVGR